MCGRVCARACMRVCECMHVHMCVCAVTAKIKISHLVIMKTMLAIKLVRKRTTPITARETARKINNNNKYDPKPEDGDNIT